MRFPERLDIPSEVLRIARRLEDAGYETWCVGGAVRDTLLGSPNKDFDLATAARPDEVRALFKRTVPVGIEHGTVAVLDTQRQPHEVTTFRRDVKTDGRHAVVEFGVSLAEDLARRDFTINAIAYHPLTHEWRDPFDGLADMDHKVIRAVGDAAQRFREDYLRILRALRFAARFGFEIVPETWEAAKANVSGLQYLSAERVRDEWFRGLQTAGSAEELLELWRDVGAVGIWLAEIEQGGGKREEGGVIGRFPTRDPVLLTSYLSSDPVATLTRLKCSNVDIERGRRIAEYRARWPDASDPVSVRRWMVHVGPAVDDLLAIANAEGWGAELESAVSEVRASKAPLTVGDLAVNGNDLQAAGVPAGPMLGELLRELLEHVIENPLMNQRDLLLARVRERLREGGGGRSTAHQQHDPRDREGDRRRR